MPKATAAKEQSTEIAKPKRKRNRPDLANFGQEYIEPGDNTYGNPPSATMYQTGKELQQEILRIAREVFTGGS